VCISHRFPVKHTLFSFLFITAIYFLYTLNPGHMNFHNQPLQPNVDVIVSTNKPDKNFYEKIKTKESVRTLIIGDSIGEGAGAANKNETWFARVTASLEATYQVTNTITNLSTGGASVLGGWTDYNLNKDIKDQYDLVFICFGQNDQGDLPLSAYENIYEALIRQIKEEKGNPEIFLIIENAIKKETLPDAVMKLAAHYDLSVIDSRLAFGQSGIPDAELSDDGVHPSSKGQELYHELMMNTIQTNLQKQKKVTDTGNTSPLFADSNSYKIFNFTNTYSTINGFSSKQGKSMGSTKGNSLEAVVPGTALGITLMQSPNGGKLDVYVDGAFIKELDSYSPSSRRNTFLIGDSFDAGSHQIMIEISGKKTRESKGTRVEILGFSANSI
jgi:lysophospholipase L1-like esterase